MFLLMNIKLFAAIAIGYIGDKSKLPQELQEREEPSPKKQLLKLHMKENLIKESF